VRAAWRAEGVVTAGLVALAAALAVASAVGITWRATNGRMRRQRGSEPISPAPASPAPGSLMPAGPEAASAGPRAGRGTRITPAQLGQPLGERATLVQFSSAFCAPCRATRRILAETAGMTEGVAHVEIDAESRLDLVRALGVLRTPTVLVLAADGRIAARASGQPRKADVIGALGEAIDSSAIGHRPADSAAIESRAAPADAEADISYSSGLETG
jgi:thiol-disulfide isomerase/thioredoxin